MEDNFLNDRYGAKPDFASETALTEDENVVLAALFAIPGAVSPGDLAKALGSTSEAAAGTAESLCARLSRIDGALLVKHTGDKYELSTNEKYFDRLSPIVRDQKPPTLTDTMLETLAIIAEKGSATRVDIENIRGVKSDFAVNKLVEYGLIEEKGRLSLPGRPMVFAPTDEFSRRFGIKDMSGMPKISEDTGNEPDMAVQLELKDLLGE